MTNLIMLKRIYIYALIISTIVCSCSRSSGQNYKISRTTDTTLKGYDSVLQAREKLASQKSSDSIGELISKIYFRVKTDDLKDFEDGYIPWIELANPNKDLKKLIGRDSIVINENKIKVIIDYPLKTPFSFEVNSEKGFTKAQLVQEISKNYHKIYSEEESSANKKTLPAKERKTVYNRNETDGKYGIWGHDLSDLALDNIQVYKNAAGEIILSLDIDS